MGKTSYNKQEWSTKGFKDFIVPELVAAPYTTIQNRAKVEDKLKGLMSTERIPFTSIGLLNNEFGANGETVYELSTKDARIRFIGDWQNGNTPAYGANVYAGSANQIMEVTFYGTGVNILINAPIGRSMVAKVDNGNYGSNLIDASSSNILGDRGYAANIVKLGPSGLELGWHTATFKDTLGYPNNAMIQGIEIVNESSQVKFPVGSAFCGMKKESLKALTESAYDAGVVGTKGARVVKYIKDGAISQVVAEVPNTPSYFESSDFSNSELIRKINFKEFGANRSDDFSTLTNGAYRNSAFTLDDGTTTLVGNNNRLSTYLSVDVLRNQETSGYFTLTFVGTGLSIIRIGSGTAGASDADQTRMYVDGVLEGITPTIGNGINVLKLCSDLPYGTHTVKLALEAEGGPDVGYTDFFIYGPKKPELPVGAVEICDYNVMADFVANNTANIIAISQGVLRKSKARENALVGSFAGGSVDTTDTVDGIGFSSSTNGGYQEFTFLGTGFDFRGFNWGSGSPASTNNSVSVDGVNVPDADVTIYGDWTYSSEVLSQAGVSSGNGAGCGFIVTGLPYGLHKLRITNNTTDYMICGTLDAIVPIHINDSSLKVGSLGLKSNETTTPIPLDENGEVDWSKAKALLEFDQANNKILYSRNIAQVLYISAGNSLVYLEKPFKDDNYVVTGVVVNGGANWVSTNNQRPASLQIYTNYYQGSNVDKIFTVAFFGELENE